MVKCILILLTANLSRVCSIMSKLTPAIRIVEMYFLNDLLFSLGFCITAMLSEIDSSYSVQFVVQTVTAAPSGSSVRSTALPAAASW